MRIGDREIGPGALPYVIAEIGVNHDGSADRAMELVDAAAAAGASAVKLQMFEADLLLSKSARLAAYQSHAGENDPQAMLHRLELSASAMDAVCWHARRQGLHAIVTVFSGALVAQAERLGIDAYKTASPDVVNKPLLDQLAATGKPLIVSTGAATLEEVRHAAGWLEPAIEQHRIAMLHCVSAYPTPIEAAALAGIRAIEATVRGIVVGYSDHTQCLDTGALAVAAGACVLEKHLTHDRAAAGPDHAASLEPEQLADYIRQANRAWTMLGQGKRVETIEGEVRLLSRQSIVATRDIAAGETLTPEALCIKRPGTGLAPWMLDEIIGTHTARAIAADTPLVAADIAWSGASRRPPETQAA